MTPQFSITCNPSVRWRSMMLANSFSASGAGGIRQQYQLSMHTGYGLIICQKAVGLIA
jgi:hypothetical protein